MWFDKLSDHIWVIKKKSMKPEVQKLMWRSRRGMLELDKLFRGFLEEQGDDLSIVELQQFEQLLEYQDQDLFDAFNNNRELDDPGLQQLFQQIKGDQ